VLKHSKVSVLIGADYAAVVREAALERVRGGTIYDAVLLKCALKSEAENFFILNPRHIQNIAPKPIASRIVSP
jgi:hypothetical protein